MQDLLKSLAAYGFLSREVSDRRSSPLCQLHQSIITGALEG